MMILQSMVSLELPLTGFKNAVSNKVRLASDLEDDLTYTVEKLELLRG